MSVFKEGSFYKRFSLAALLFLVALPWSRGALAATIDVMIVYDTTATTWVASHGGMSAFSQDAVNRMNQAMSNSGLSTTFRLVHSMSVAYTTQSSLNTPFNTDLNTLQAGQGAFAAVAAARDTYGADLVAMLVDTGYDYGYVGLGYMLTNWSGHSDYAHTVCAIRSVATSHTMTHEVGHNLGAHHSKYQTSDPGPNPYLDKQYSSGWYFTGANGVDYHSIMAYDSDGHGNSYQEAPLFSTPLVSYQSVAAGDAQYGDNARLLRQTQDVVAAYRGAIQAPVTGPDLAVTSVTGPSSAAAGASVQASAGVKNQGDASAGAYRLDFYLSTDATITLADTSTGWGCDMDALSAGMSDSCRGSIQIPAGLAGGLYYLGAYADTADEVAESNESNNGLAATSSILISGGVCSSTSSEWIYKSYIGYYGRCPEAGGYDYWCTRLDSEGGDLSAIIAAFGTSAEYTSVYGSLSDSEIITLLYQNMFDRAPESGGLTFYLQLLNDWRSEWYGSHGTMSGASEYALSRIALDVLNGASGGDLTTLTSKISACPAL